MLTLSDVNSFYDRSHILHDVSMGVEDKQILSVLGRNGTGKTTLLKTLMGLTDKATGRIELGGRNIGAAPTHLRARAGIAYVPQGRQIIPDFTVRENILMGAFARPDGKQAIPDLVPVLFPYLMANLGRPGGLLSGGQQQQLAIARALAAQPRMLLLDEPTEGIQPNIVAEIESHHPQTQPRGRADHHPGRTEHPLRPPGRSRFRHHGKGPGRRLGPGQRA